jgi:predicted nuclease with TOPRIM domain
MIELRNALLAAAEEAGKMQDELNTQQMRIDELTSHVAYLEHENNNLKEKLKNVGNLMRQAANIFNEN